MTLSRLTYEGRTKLSLVLLTALALFGAAPAFAAKGDASIGLQFGGSAPSGDFSNSYQPGFDGGLVGTAMISQHVGVGVDVAYHAWTGTDAASAQFNGLLGPGWTVKLNAIQTGAHAQYNFPTGGSASPYARVGWGL